MDLSKFDTRQKAEAGVVFDLVIEGETVFGDDGKPITFTIKGMADEAVQQYILKNREKEARTPKEVIESDFRLADLTVIGWSENFTVEGKKLKFSKENMRVLFANPVVRAAVLAKVFDQHAFMNGS